LENPPAFYTDAPQSGIWRMRQDNRHLRHYITWEQKVEGGGKKRKNVVIWEKQWNSGDSGHETFK
jgi:hypothetical protein